MTYISSHKYDVNLKQTPQRSTNITLRVPIYHKSSSYIWLLSQPALAMITFHHRIALLFLMDFTYCCSFFLSPLFIWEQSMFSVLNPLCSCIQKGTRKTIILNAIVSTCYRSSKYHQLYQQPYSVPSLHRSAENETEVEL